MHYLVAVLFSLSSSFCFAVEKKRIYLIQKDENTNIYKVEFSDKSSSASQIFLRDPSMVKGPMLENNLHLKKLVYHEPKAKKSLLAFKVQNIKGLFREPRVKFEREEMAVGLRDGAQVESLKETDNFNRVLEDLRDFSQ